MPYALCPVCGNSYHLSVRGSPQEWEAEHVKERDPNGTPLLKCIRCWVEFRPGHKITIRTLSSRESGALVLGQEGVVTSVEGSNIQVAFGDLPATFKREDLFYVVGQPPAA